MAKRTIISDIESLHKKSTPVDFESTETLDLIHNLYDSLPEKQLGLAAPQIGVLSRVFVAWFPSLQRTYAFVNPCFIEKSDDTTDSTEGCLSLPGISRTVERCAHVILDAERIVEFLPDFTNVMLKDTEGPLPLAGLDAIIVQHEYDHLDGVILTDLPIIKSREEKMQEKMQGRQARIQAKRQAKATAKAAASKTFGAKKSKSKKEIEKDKKRARKLRQRQKRVVEIAERYKTEQEGLFDPSA